MKYFVLLFGMDGNEAEFIPLVGWAICFRILNHVGYHGGSISPEPLKPLDEYFFFLGNVS